MVKIKDKKKLVIPIIISVVVLILLVCCIVWGYMSNMTAITDVGQLPKDEEQVTTTEKPKNDTEADENKSQETDENISEKEETPSIQKPVVSAKPTESTKPIESSKPMVVPENVPEGEAYAVYNNTLIIGDSRTEGFKLYSGVKNASYFCMKAMTIDKIVAGEKVTIDGRTISVYDLLDGATYDKIIVGVGLNELGWNHIETFLSEYGKLIDKIKEKQPNAIIYLQAVLPVSKEKNDSDKVHNNAQVYWYNENIVKLAESKGAKFVNPAAALVDANGFLVTEATTDGVHLNSKYCKIWAKYLAEMI